MGIYMFIFLSTECPFCYFNYEWINKTETNERNKNKALVGTFGTNLHLLFLIIIVLKQTRYKHCAPVGNNYCRYGDDYWISGKDYFVGNMCTFFFCSKTISSACICFVGLNYKPLFSLSESGCVASCFEIAKYGELTALLLFGSLLCTHLGDITAWGWNNVRTLDSLARQQVLYSGTGKEHIDCRVTAGSDHRKK